jgi:hypothetical protein
MHLYKEIETGRHSSKTASISVHLVDKTREEGTSELFGNLILDISSIADE